MRSHPLAEVFGFPADNLSKEASRYRRLRLCPFNNKVPNCTKDKANDPLGVCSIYDGEDVVITCPIRFRQQWVIAEDAASFFFSPDATWTSLTEVRLSDKLGKSAGNIDIVLVSYDGHGRITDYGALEVQPYTSRETCVVLLSATCLARPSTPRWIGGSNPTTHAQTTYRPHANGWHLSSSSKAGLLGRGTRRLL